MTAPWSCLHYNETRYIVEDFFGKEHLITIHLISEKCLHQLLQLLLISITPSSLKVEIHRVINKNQISLPIMDPSFKKKNDALDPNWLHWTFA